MPTLLEAEPGTDTDPFADLIGGDGTAPAYQSVGGKFSEVPKAEINTPTDYGSFLDLIPDPLTAGARTAGADDLGDFASLVPPSPTAESEKVLAEIQQADEQAAIERAGGANMPEWANNAAEAAVEMLSGIVPRSVDDVVQLFTPYAIHDLTGTAKAVKDWIGGKPIEESLRAHKPEMFILKDAENTPAGSKERFAAAFQVLSDLGMAIGGSVAMMKKAPSAARSAVPEASAADLANHARNRLAELEQKPALNPMEQSEMNHLAANLDNADELGRTYGFKVIPETARFQEPGSAETAASGLSESPLPSAKPSVLEQPLSTAEVPSQRLPEPTSRPEARAQESQPSSPRPEPTGTEANAASRIAEAVPEYLRPDPELVRLINDDPPPVSAPATPAEPKVPRLLEGETQGDLISSTQTEDFALVGEKGVDYGKRQANAEAEARAREEARLKQESEQELLEDFQQHQAAGGDEFIDALKAEGGLPAISSTRETPFRGELQNIREELKNPNRKERISYTDIFRKDAPDEDTLTNRMRARGFAVETPGDLLNLARERIRSGRPIFGNEAAGVGMFFEPAMEGGAFGSGGGRRRIVRPKGRTPKGDANFLRIEPGLKRVFKGLERKGAADVISETRNRVGRLLAKQIRQHVDTEQEIYGQLTAKFEKAAPADKRTAAKAFDELEGYLAARENGRPVPTLSPTAQKILTAWEDVAESTGNLARANDVQVFDPVLGAHRPMGNLGRTYLPRVFKPEVERVMRDPKQNATLWNNLVDAFAKHRGISDIEAAKELRAEAGRFSANDFMGNLERARTGQLPEIFYDYDLRRVAARYIPSFSERMSQIIAYGQRLGPREKPMRENLWDIARKEAENEYTQRWLNSAEDQAVNLRSKTTAGIAMARGQTLASGMLLSSPTTSVVRNTLSGLTATAEVMGVRRALAPMVQALRKAERANAREMGAVRADMGDFLHADQLGQGFWDDVIRGVTDKALKFSGYNGSEVFVRTHGALTAAQFARDGVAAIAKNPASMRSKEALAMFQRMGVDAKKVVAEGADWRSGAETRKFIRTVLRDTQGGYRFDQVPLWANGNTGRLLYQFGRWGTQRARNIWKNGIKPAIGEEVQWNGKTMTRRDLRPLAKMALSSVVLGEAFAGVAAGFFGRDRKDASLHEIAEAWDEDKKLAFGLAAERAINDIIMAGTMGIWGQPVDWAKSLKNQSRLKNPTEPPALASVTALTDLGRAFIDQGGTLTHSDLLKFAGEVTPGAKQLTDVARNVMDEPLYEAQNDVKTLRAAAQRWAKQEGMDVSPRSRGDFRKSAMAPVYEPIKEALLVGDAQTAKVLAQDFLSQQPDPKARGKARQSLKASIEASQPFRAGPYTAKQYRTRFQEWARKNLNEADYLQTKRIQERYVRAAQAAELW